MTNHPNRSKQQTAKHTPGYIADALTCFIRSGSTNGVEKSRKEMLVLVPLFAAAPETATERDRLKELNAELLVALKLVARDINIPGTPFCTIETALAVRAAIAKAEGR